MVLVYYAYPQTKQFDVFDSKDALGHHIFCIHNGGASNDDLQNIHSESIAVAMQHAGMLLH